MADNRNWMFCGVAALAVAAQASPAAGQSLEQRRTFNVPAQPVADALIQFSRQSNVQVVTASADVGSRRSRAVSGALTVRAALNRLLEGTGLVWRQTSPGSIVVEASAAVAQPAAVESETIMVTGSRIRRPNLESVVPVTTVSGEEFFQTGQTAIGDVLNELPSLRSTISQSNSTRLTDLTGVNLLDLRGLGVDRTLVLQNGRRHVPGAPRNTAPDVNTIPTDLIERVDIITGGSSAVYGSDAIAGVVNFVLRRDFEGLQLRGQAGVSQYGDAQQYYGSALWGTNFGGGRGNVAVNLEYAKQQDWYGSQRRRYSTLAFPLPVDSDPPGTPNGSDGNPDRVLFEDVRTISATNSGQFIDFITGPDGYYGAYVFQPDGTLIPRTGRRIGFPPLGQFQGGNGSTFREGDSFQLVPDTARYSINLIGHYEISEAFVPFVEAKYVRVDSLGSSVGPFFAGLGQLGPRDLFFTDNPFLRPEVRDFINGLYGVPPGGSTSFFFTRNFLELGSRKFDAQRETYRIVAGARGEFNDDWSYELSANVAEVSSRTNLLGNVNVQRWLLANDPVRDPATGSIVCRSRIDPAARIAYEDASDPAFAQARLAEDVAQCVPLNPFGEGNISPEARNYVLTDTWTRSKLTQFVANASLSGDFSDWFELPGGPVGFAIGAEYRRETFRNAQDPLTEAGLTFNAPAPAFDPPPFEVAEAFAELRIPLLRDRPFFEELTLNAAGRIADYRGRVGTVVAWNGGVEWTPVTDLRLRANYARAVRAPNLVEIFDPVGQSFASSPVTDPCLARNIGAGSATRVANCRADGVPDGFDFEPPGSFPYLSGGNINLGEERSNSLTVGAILQPRFVPGLSLSVDYYSIKVNDVIATPGVQEVLTACYDAADINNQFCALFDRFRGTGRGPNGERTGQILINSLTLLPLNFAGLKVRGIDLEATYRRRIEGLGSIDTRFTYTRVLQNDAFLNPADPGRADQKLFELGDPRDAFNWNVSLRTGPVTFGYQMRYIGRMVPGTIENIRSVQGRDPENEDAFDIRYLPDAFYHDLRIGIDVGNRFNFYLGVDNLTNRFPPYGLTGVTGGVSPSVGGGSIYDTVGRFFYAGAVARF